MAPLSPPPLFPGDTIALVAPSGYVEEARLQSGIAVLKSLGFRVYEHQQLQDRHNQSAGTPEQKVAAFHSVVRDAGVKGIVGAWGGNRAMTMLDLLDYDLIRKHPKTYMGFSDSTALLNALYSKAGLTSIHGPLVSTMGKLPLYQVETAFDLFAGKNMSFPLEGTKVIVPGKAAGPLIGGTLSVFASLLGTPYLPDTAGAILFLEDMNEELSRIDRMLWTLRKVLPFEKLSGIIFGEFLGVQDTGRPFGFTLEDIIRDHCGALAIPVLMNAPFGHGATFYPMRFGARADFKAVPYNSTLDF